MKLYQTDYDGFFVGEGSADPDPLNPENWLIPAGCVTEAPPDLTNNQVAKWVAGAWTVIEIPTPEEPQPVEPSPPTREEQETNRQAAYVNEADPLFFKWQAGEATEAEWLAKRQEIRDRFPYPE